jgi:hypothetical protein
MKLEKLRFYARLGFLIADVCMNQCSNLICPLESDLSFECTFQASQKRLKAKREVTNKNLEPQTMKATRD